MIKKSKFYIKQYACKKSLNCQKNLRRTAGTINLCSKQDQLFVSLFLHILISIYFSGYLTFFYCISIYLYVFNFLFLFHLTSGCALYSVFEDWDISLKPSQVLNLKTEYPKTISGPMWSFPKIKDLTGSVVIGILSYQQKKNLLLYIIKSCVLSVSIENLFFLIFFQYFFKFPITV